MSLIKSFATPNDHLRSLKKDLQTRNELVAIRYMSNQNYKKPTTTEIRVLVWREQQNTTF